MIELQAEMTLIEAIIRQEKLKDVVDKLTTVVVGMTVSEVRGHGRQRGPSAVYRGVDYHLTLVPTVMSEIVSDDNKADDVLKVLAENAKTGEIGDGPIVILPV